MGNFGEIKQAVADIINQPLSDTDNLRKIVASIKWVNGHIAEQFFEFLKTTAYINVAKNTFQYALATGVKKVDRWQICTTPNIVGSIATWTLDSSANKTGSVDVALDSDVDASSIITIGGIDYIIQSVTGDGTTANDIELDIAAPTGTVVYITSSSQGNKNIVDLKPALSLNEIRDYPAQSTKNVPVYYFESGVDSDELRTVWIGLPTSDDIYLVPYDYYQKMVIVPSTGDNTFDFSADTDESLVSKVYGDDPTIFGAVWYAYNNYWHEDRANLYHNKQKTGYFDLEIAKMQQGGQLPYRNQLNISG